MSDQHDAFKTEKAGKEALERCHRMGVDAHLCAILTHTPLPEIRWILYYDSDRKIYFEELT